jgi:hypothetical protein
MLDDTLVFAHHSSLHPQSCLPRARVNHGTHVGAGLEPGVHMT